MTRAEAIAHYLGALGRWRTPRCRPGLWRYVTPAGELPGSAWENDLYAVLDSQAGRVDLRCAN